MTHLRAAVIAVAGLLVALAAVGWFGFSGAPSQAATDCTPRTAWAGSETTLQHNGNTLMQIPVAEPIEVQRLTVSNSYAEQRPGYGEELLLVGADPGPLAVGADLLPSSINTPDPAFGTVGVRTTGNVSHNENRVMADLWSSHILKTTTGSASTLVDETYSPPRQVPAGDVLWVFYGSVSVGTLDPEAQVAVTFIPAGC